MNQEIANQFVMDSMGGNDPRHKEWADKMQRIIDKQEKDEMTDQYKELREVAENFALYGQAWAKQALQLLDEMDAVGAGGVSGMLLIKDKPENKRILDIMINGQTITLEDGCNLDDALNKLPLKIEMSGPWPTPFEAIPGELAELEGTPGLRQWVELILMADDETKAILRQGLKEEIELMFSRSIEVAPTNDGWVEWNGGGMPIPLGVKVDVRHRSGSTHLNCTAGVAGSYAETWWHNECPMDYDIIAYRIVK